MTDWSDGGPLEEPHDVWERSTEGALRLVRVLRWTREAFKEPLFFWYLPSVLLTSFLWTSFILFSQHVGGIKSYCQTLMSVFSILPVGLDPALLHFYISLLTFFYFYLKGGRGGGSFLFLPTAHSGHCRTQRSDSGQEREARCVSD